MDASPPATRHSSLATHYSKQFIYLWSLVLVLWIIPFFRLSGQLQINDLGYFEMPGLNVTVFSDIYPEGHQTGVSIIQHGVRVAANGDLRLEPSPGQWSPVPKGGKLVVDDKQQRITQRLWYPDSSKNRRGFNPILYPDLNFEYEVSVTAVEQNSFRITVDLQEPIPPEWAGKMGFNLELFPGHIFGKAYLMDGRAGIFPMQPNGPVRDYHGEYLADPLAVGKTLIIAPETAKQRMRIETKTGSLELWDGRTNHNNSWFIIRSEVPENVTDNVIEWVITPNVESDWRYEPVVQISQVGYHPGQKKVAVIEQDKADGDPGELEFFRLTPEGKQKVMSGKPVPWGHFLRYHYLTYDFSEIKEPGMYVIRYRSFLTSPFKIDEDVYSRHVWQPTLEYYLPVQMCHMRVNEKYRVWHGLCHDDDALMAPVDTNHFDGYVQGHSTLTRFHPLEAVPGLNAGGWHDAGDYDLRVESQIGTVWLLAMMVEEFGLEYDATLIDQEKKLVEIHVPDGKPDALQQIEHGLLSVLGGYRALGRLYRGIICSDLRQYVMLGDGSTMTDNQVYDPNVSPGASGNSGSGIMDDRWVFTEENPDRELYVAAGLAAASRVLRSYNPDLSKECLETALDLWKSSGKKARRATSRVLALSELILSTGEDSLKQTFVEMKDDMIKNIARCGWAVGRVIQEIDDPSFKEDMAAAVSGFQSQLKSEAQETPFGVPYKPNIWGAGWTIQRFGVEQYFFHKAWPEHAPADFFVNALHFILGAHPGENTASFASGVGSHSVTVAYGVNRADWSYIPGGVASGTALIRPDLPELKVWPFFWQQTEYVMGGGATNFIFLVKAVESLFAD